jgi:rubrerythrin
MEKELEDLLNLLLEAERAGVQALQGMSEETADPEVKSLFRYFSEVEVKDCASLEKLIHDHGGTPSAKTGDFAEKVLNLDSLHDQMNLLSRGQAWTARKVEQALALNPSPEIAAFLKEMANRHRHHMEWARAEAIKAFDE